MSVNKDVITEYNFMKRCYTPILPLVYSEALSYIETLGQFAVKLNEVVDAMNELGVDITDELKHYVDTEIAKQLVVIEEAVRQCQAIADTMDGKYQQFEDLVNARITFMNNRIDELNRNLIAGLNSAHQYTDDAIKQNNEYILEEIGKGLVDLRVLNYFTGEYVTVQQMFDYLAEFHLDNAITYAELSEADKTYNQLISIDATYTDWAVRGGELI